MIDFDEAMRRVIQLPSPLTEEDVPLPLAHGRILAGPVIAAISSPPADVSSMDGYAVCEDDLRDPPARLPVVRENFAGTADVGSITPGECARIFTGAALPAGADRVVMQENVERDRDWAVFATTPAGPSFIRTKGSDFTEGSTLMQSGTPLGPRQLVAAAGADLASVSCWKQPRVYVLSTGNELAEPGTARTHPGTVPDSLSIGITAAITKWGGISCGTERLPDRLPQMESAAAKAVDESDVVVVTGGASVGERDFAKAMFMPLDLELAFQKVAMKPGKPVWFGRVGKTLVLGLAGNPTSAMVTARLFLAPLLAVMTGRDPKIASQWRNRILSGQLPACGDRETFVRAVETEDGSVAAIENQDSGAQRALADAEFLVRRMANAPAVSAGETVPVLKF